MEEKEGGGDALSTVHYCTGPGDVSEFLDLGVVESRICPMGEGGGSNSNGISVD